MANTRSKQQQQGTDKKPTKIKFSESDDEPSNANDSQYFSAEDEGETNELQQDAGSDESDSESDSDAAPEEESTSTSKEAILEKQKEEFRLRQERNRQQREKRRQLDLQNQQQQEEAKNSRKKQASIDDLPEFLPTDILGSDDEQEESIPTTIIKNKHLKLDDLDEIELKRQAKLQKLKDLKNSKKTVVKKGPVMVQVQNFNSRKVIVPAAESKIIESRENWLKRKSLRRK